MRLFSKTMKAGKLLFSCLAFAVLLISIQGNTQAAGTVDVSLMKGVYLYNFIRFAAWPDDPGSRTRVIVAVYGSPVFADTLEMISQKSEYPPHMQVRRCQTVSCVDGAHVLYAHKMEDIRLAALLKHVAKHPVMTVSDQAAFVRQGGMLELVEEEGHLRFDANLKAVRDSGLYLSADVLDMARTVVNQ